MDSGIRLILTDMDGTLLSPDLTVSPSNRQAILDARAAGVETAIATGRLDLLVLDYVRQLDIRLPVVSCNGALIRDCSTGEIVHMKSVPADSAEAVLELCLELGIDALAYAPDAVYHPRYSRRVSFFNDYNRLAAAGGTPPVPLHAYDRSDVRAIAAAGVFKIFLARLRDGDIEQAARRIRAEVPDIGTVNSVGDSLDVMHAEVSKGEALRILAAHAGLTPSQVAAFGDSENDVSMFEAAGVSFAMGNARPDVRAAATHVTASNREDGFAEAVRRHILRES